MDKQSTITSYAWYLTKICLLFCIYFLAAKFGLGISPVSGFATLVWPPTGIALVALFIFGKNMWPGVFLGAFLVNFMTGAPLIIALGIAAGNTLEAVVGAYLLGRFNFNASLERLDDVLALIFCAALLSTMISATVGVTSLFFAGIVSVASYATTWTAWWIGDMLGNLIIASFLFAWLKKPWPRLASEERFWEFFIVASSIITLSVFIFSDLGKDLNYISLVYLIFPLLIWLAIRFGQRSVVTMMLAISVIAISGTVSGFGPFIHGTVSDTLLQLQLFMGVFSVTIMILAAVVAERKQAEKLARRSNSELKERAKEIEAAKLFIEKEKVKYEALLSGVGDSVAAVDVAGKIIFVNYAFEKMFGWAFSQIQGKPIADVVPMENEKGEAVAPKYRPVNITLEDKKMSQGTFYCIRKDATKFIAALNSSPVVLENNVIGAVSVYRDITREKEIDKSKTEFIYLISHQLRTPLTAIKWYLEMLSSETSGALNIKQKKYVEAIRYGNERMVRLINNLLNIARIEMGRLVVNIESVDVRKLLEEAIKEQQPEILKRNQTVIVSQAQEPVMVSTDSVLLFMVLQNLIANSVKYTLEHGMIRCTIKISGANILLEINDNGIGIPKEEQKRIFEKLFRASNSTVQNKEGNGLGLYIIKKIVDIFGGQIWFESEENKGTTFYLTLPIKPSR